MPDHDMINGVQVPFTVERQAERDAEVAEAVAEQAIRVITTEIFRLEAAMTPRRLREHLDGTEVDGWWTAQNALINAERSKL